MSSQIDKSINQVLAEFGLAKREVAIYLALLKNGPSSIVEVAKASGVKRTTAHNNVDELISRGLASQIKVGGRRKVMAEDPDSLYSLLESKRHKINSLENSLEGISRSLREMSKTESASNSLWFRYYEGIDSLAALYDEALNDENIQEIFLVANVKEVLKIFPENAGKFTKALQKRKFKVYDIIISDGEGYDLPSIGEGYKPRYLKMSSIHNVTVDFLVYGDKVVFMDLENKPVTALRIENHAVASAISILVKELWSRI